MDAPSLLTRLAELIDARQWDDLGPLLRPDFSCRYVHTGEVLDRDGWVRLNAVYPGFDRMVLAEVVGVGDRAASRAHVTGWADGELRHFEVATFITARDGLVAEMTEVWTDVDQTPPPEARPT